MSEDLPLAKELAAVYARMSDLLLTRETVHTALGLVTSLAKQTVSEASGAGVTLVDEHGRRVTAAATDDAVERADALQYQLDEGPCLAAWERSAVIRVDDIEDDERWPRWRDAVRPFGLCASLSAPLVAGGTTLGALKVYALRPSAFGDRDENLLTAFAAQAAILLSNVQAFDQAQRLSDALRDAMRSRDRIGIAKGILMAREGVREDTAFALLASQAQREGRALRDAAEVLIATAGRRR